MHFSLPNHFGERNSKLGSAHGSSQGNHHGSFFFVYEMSIGLGGCESFARIEMPEMLFHERRNGHFKSDR